MKIFKKNKKMPFFMKRKNKFAFIASNKSVNISEESRTSFFLISANKETKKINICTKINEETYYLAFKPESEYKDLMAVKKIKDDHFGEFYYEERIFKTKINDQIYAITFSKDNVLVLSPYATGHRQRIKKVSSNSYPLTKISSSRFVEGYWAASIDAISEYPFPLKTNEEVDEDFIYKLREIEILIEKKSSDDFEFNHYKGYSKCRLCDDEFNGSCEYGFKFKNNWYIFPEGLKHYYEEHNVQPSNEFKDAVMKFDLKKYNKARNRNED